MKILSVCFLLFLVSCSHLSGRYVSDRHDLIDSLSDKHHYYMGRFDAYLEIHDRDKARVYLDSMEYITGKLNLLMENPTP